MPWLATIKRERGAYGDGLTFIYGGMVYPVCSSSVDRRPTEARPLPLRMVDHVPKPLFVDDITVSLFALRMKVCMGLGAIEG